MLDEKPSQRDIVDVTPLFEPLTVKGITLKNRFVLAGMQRFACSEGRPLPSMVEFFRSRVEGGVAMVMTEACAVDHPSATQEAKYAWVTEATLDAWAKCADAVKGEGGHLIIQLWHEGAFRAEGGDGPYARYPTISPSGLFGPDKKRGVPASLQDLEDIKAAFVRSALGAQQIGASGVEIHVSGGYLLDAFVWPETNLRTDKYGGDLNARLRYPAEIVTAVRAAVGPDFLISCRLSQWKREAVDARGLAANPEELEIVVKTLEQAGVEMFQPGAWKFWEPEWPGSDLSIAGWIKTFTSSPVVAVGGVGLDADILDNYAGVESKFSKDVLQKAVDCFQAGQFDLLAVGRALICEPAWVNKVREGRYDEIHPFLKEKLYEM